MAERNGEFRQKANRRRADTQWQIDQSGRRILGGKDIFVPSADISKGKVTRRETRGQSFERAFTSRYGR